jgi:hypothetical protein
MFAQRSTFVANLAWLHSTESLYDVGLGFCRERLKDWFRASCKVDSLMHDCEVAIQSPLIRRGSQRDGENSE